MLKKKTFTRFKMHHHYPSFELHLMLLDTMGVDGDVLRLYYYIRRHR
jgi:hypothetical protein